MADIGEQQMRGPNARVARLVYAVQQAIGVTNSLSCPRWVACPGTVALSHSVGLVSAKRAGKTCSIVRNLQLLPDKGNEHRERERESDKGDA